MKWEKIKDRVAIFMFILVFMFANLAFWVSWHNLDLLQNYSLIFNDINRNEFCSEDFYDVRGVEDCNLFGCGTFENIYVVSKSFALFSYMLFNGLVIEFLVRAWKRKSR